MGKINKIFIVLTPFQKKVFHQLFLEQMKSKNSLIIVKENLLIKEDYVNILNWVDYEFSLDKFLKNPFKNISGLKIKIKKIENQLKNLFEQCDFEKELELIIGTDKDVFTQILINKLEKNKIKFNTSIVEEGIGVYVRTSITDKCLEFLYPIASNILFKNKLYYIKRLGSHPVIKKFYLREPQLLLRRNDSIEYIKFKLSRDLNSSNSFLSNTILIYSFPPNLERYIKEEKKIWFYKEIASFLSKYNRKLHIKPHPRENIDSLSTLIKKTSNTNILNKNISGEDINYFDYEYIINFSSSIIIDLINQEYPFNRIITIAYNKKTNFDLNEEKLKIVPFKKIIVDKLFDFE